MNAHQLDADGVIINTIVVDSLDILPNLVDASIGGGIGDRIVDGEVVPKSGPSVANLMSAFIKQVDNDVDAIYAATVGNRTPEYTVAESEAQSFKDAGYPSDSVPQSVSSWATATANSATWAADDILITAAQWRGAQASIRDSRLNHKENAKRAATVAEVATIATSWDAFVSTIRHALGL